MARKVGLLLLFLFLVLAAPVWASVETGTSSATKPDCREYYTYQLPDGSWSCEVLTIFPWYAAQTVASVPVWKTAIALSSSPAKKPIAFDSGLLAGRYVIGGWVTWGTSIFTLMSGIATSTQAGGNVEVNFVAGAGCAVVNAVIKCEQTEDLATGSLWIRLLAADADTLDNAQVQLVFHGYIDGVEKTQVSVKPFYHTKMSPAWYGASSETPMSMKGFATAHNGSFAVVNLAEIAQAITVTVRDNMGNVIASKQTPVLAAAITVPFQPGTYPKDVFAATLGDFFGELPVKVVDNWKYAPITVTFEGASGGNIAPLLLRFIGESMTSVELRPVQ